MIAIPKPEEIYPHLNPEAQYRVSREYYRNRSLKRLLSVAGSSFLPVALSVASWAIILNPALNVSIKTMLGREVAHTEVVENNNNGIAVVDAATAWTGKSYKPGVAAMCASFVRTVLTESGVDIPVPAGSWGPLMADSFYAPESGQIIHDKAQLMPGDIVMFANTYNGPGRVINGRKITHVGIYLGEGMMVDRPTRSRPVQHRSINTFEFHSALRPSGYAVKPEFTNTSKDAQAIKNTAAHLGLDPVELTALMSWESAGTLNPSVMGGDGGKYMGLIQFSPYNQQKYDVVPGQSIAEQMPKVMQYLLDAGFRPGEHGIEHAYSAILAGNPNESHWGLKDSNGTSASNAAHRFSSGPHYEKAKDFLGVE